MKVSIDPFQAAVESFYEHCHVTYDKAAKAGVLKWRIHIRDRQDVMNSLFQHQYMAGGNIASPIINDDNLFGVPIEWVSSREYFDPELILRIAAPLKEVIERERGPDYHEVVIAILVEEHHLSPPEATRITMAHPEIVRAGIMSHSVRATAMAILMVEDAVKTK